MRRACVVSLLLPDDADLLPDRHKHWENIRVPRWHQPKCRLRPGAHTRASASVPCATVLFVTCTGSFRDGLLLQVTGATRPVFTVLAIYHTKFCWVGKLIHVIMKPTNSPTQGKPIPRKIRSKVAFGPLFRTAFFFFVGWD